MVESIRQRFGKAGFTATLAGNLGGYHPRALKKEDEERLIALARGPKPEGRRRWTLRLLRDAWETLGYTGTKKVSYETIRKILKEAGLNLAAAGEKERLK
jgi:transposase